MSEDEKKRREVELVQAAWTKEEEREIEEHRAEHPWRLTVSQFLDRVRHLYGFVFQEVATGTTVLRYLKSPDDALVGLLPVGLAMDDQLDEFTTASLCRHFRIPPEDFGLTRESLDDEIPS